MKPRILKFSFLFFSVMALSALTLNAPPSALADQGGLQTAKIEPALLAAINANPNGQFSVIVQTGLPDSKNRSAKANSDRAHGAADRIKANGGKGTNTLAIIGGASGKLSADGIAKTSRDPFVSFISLDKPLKPLGTPASGSLYTQIVRAPQVWAQGITGQGVAVAVIDSGVAAVDDLALPASRIIASIDLTSTDNSPRDPGGHGTHVAGIITGNGYDSAQSYEGVAPGANIVSVRVIGSDGTTLLSTVVRGIQWVIQNRQDYNIRVINLSLGAPASRGYESDPLAAAVELAWHSGIVVVTAAGNGGPNAGTIVTPGFDPYVITVGATDDAGTLSIADDTVPWFSSRGPTFDGFPKPDLVAPGRKIISLRALNSYLDNSLPDRRTGNAYFRLTGTSMSSPVVAGTVALVLQKNPGLKPNQVKSILTRTAYPLGANTDVNSSGAGLVDAYAAVNSTFNSQANRGLRPSDEFCKAVYSILRGMPLTGNWRDLSYQGINWSNITWDNIVWDNITWDNIVWDNITWDNITWDTTGSWSNITWDNITWDSNSAPGSAESAGWESLGDLD
ncbi:MAG: S8 family peptidase [Chloroflexota bacterium]|nr:S8 family peptidase [Chloroflexota bacterium]